MLLTMTNRVLAAFLPGDDRRSSVAPREQAGLWRESPPARRLDRILCLKG
jgi:hypothetical protein